MKNKKDSKPKNEVLETDEVTEYLDDDVKKKNDYALNSLTQFEEESTPPPENEVLKKLLDTKDINLKTELSDTEIKEIAKLQVIAGKCRSEILYYFLEEFKSLRVSKNRQGRKEIIGSSLEDKRHLQQGFMGEFMNNIFGGGNRGQGGGF